MSEPSCFIPIFAESCAVLNRCSPILISRLTKEWIHFLMFQHWKALHTVYCDNKQKGLNLLLKYQLDFKWISRQSWRINRIPLIYSHIMKHNLLLPKQPQQLVWPVSVTAWAAENRQSAAYPRQRVMSSTSGLVQSAQHLWRGFQLVNLTPVPSLCLIFPNPAHNSRL